MQTMRAVFLLFIMAMAFPAWTEEAASRVIENGGTGNYSAIMMTEPSLPTHTLFRPANIDKFKATEA